MNQDEVFQHCNNNGELLQPKAVAGDVRFVAVNLDGVINEDDRTNIGNPTPDMTFGFNADRTWKWQVQIPIMSGYDFSAFHVMSV